MTDIETQGGTTMPKIQQSGTSGLNGTGLLNNFPVNNVLYQTMVQEFYNETDFSFHNEYLSRNYSQYNDSVHSLKVQEYNTTVFSGYPQELLRFGAISFIVFAVVGVLGNFISILALSKCKRLRNATTAFIVNLCVADFLFCGFSMPLSALMFISKIWYLGEALCKLFPLIRYSNGAVSVFSVIAITVNRYILIVHPKLYPVLYTKVKIAVMIGLIWVTSLMLLLFPLLEIWGKLGYDPKVGTCTILKVNGKSPKIFLYIAAFGFPSIIFVICYTRIFFVVRRASRKANGRKSDMGSGRTTFTIKNGWLRRRCRHTERPQTQHRGRTELRILRVMLVIFILFLLCYFPVSFVKIFRRESDLPILNVLGYFSVYFSNIINPIIYIVMSNEYRRAYIELFCQAKVKRQIILNRI